MRTSSIVITVLLALALLLPASVLAADSVTVALAALNNSGVSGIAILTADDGGTSAVLTLTGLAPSATAKVSMYGGTCAYPSASFAPIADVKGDPSGKAAATGAVLYRGTDKVLLTTMADAAHIIIVNVGDKSVACGVIPALATPAAAPKQLPAAGDAMPAAMLAALGVLGIVSGLLLRRRI